MSNIDKQARQVQRYANFGVDMMEWADGGYVKHSDYLALLEELEGEAGRVKELESQRQLAFMASNRWADKFREAEQRSTEQASIIAKQEKWIKDVEETMIAATDHAEAAERRIAEMEAIAKSVTFDPIPMEDLGNKSDGKKHPYMFGAGYNSAVVHCESVLLQAFSAAGTAKGE